MNALPPRLTRLSHLLAVSAVSLLLTGLLNPGAAHAAAAEQPVRLSAKPVGQPGQFFDLTLAPGEVRRLEIALGNNGRQPVAVRTYAANAYTIINGGFGAALRDGAVAGTTTWLDYPRQVLTLKPGRATVRAFSVTVPPGTPPGEYLTSLLLENDAPVKGTGSVALDQIVRQAVAVAVRVPGPLRPGLAIGAASHKVAADRSVIAVDVTNTGNRRLTPSAELVVRDSTGADVSRATVPMDSFYADTTTKVEVTLARTLIPGSYTVDLTLDDDARGAQAEASGLALTVVAPVRQPDAVVPDRQQVVDVLQASPAGLPTWVVLLAALGLAAAGAVALRIHSGRRLRVLHSHAAGTRRSLPEQAAELGTTRV